MISIYMDVSSITALESCDYLYNAQCAVCQPHIGYDVSAASEATRQWNQLTTVLDSELAAASEATCIFFGRYVT